MLDLDPSRYAATTNTPPHIVAGILQATHEMYVDLVRPDTPYESIKRQRLCLAASTRISDGLGGPDGYETDTRSVYFAPKGAVDDPRIFHLVATVMAPELEEPVIVDATWQQFLPRLPLTAKFRNLFYKRWNYPEVLIGTPHEVEEVVRSIGFNAGQASTWNPATPAT